MKFSPRREVVSEDLIWESNPNAVMTTVLDLQKMEHGEQVILRGWAQDLRLLKNIRFLILRDYTGTIQITAKNDATQGYDLLEDLPRESIISVEGMLNRESKSKAGMEISATSIKVLNRSDLPLPLGVTDKIESDLETRLNNRYLDLRKPETGIVFEAESDVLWGIRKHLNANGFVEVHTPKIVAASTEGGADLFHVKYFEKEAYLSQSPQLYKEILVSAGINRVFEVGPAFRAEKHNTVQHLNEFSSIDIEMAFSDHNDAMNMLQDSVLAGIGEVKDHLGDRLKQLNLELPEPVVPFPKITYEECVTKLNKLGEKIEFGEDFSPEQLRIIGKDLPDFYFIVKFPASLRAFYTMPDPEDHRLSNSFDLQFRGLELTSGAQRVHDPEMLKQRLIAKDLNPDDFSFYLNAFRYGMPPHAGWAIGLERLVMILLGLQNIREATLFPRDRTRITP